MTGDNARGVTPDLLAHACDIDINGAVCHDHISWPNLVEQLLSGEDLALVG